MKQIPIILNKEFGGGKPNVLSIGKIGNEVASTLCSRDFKGVYRASANAILVIYDDNEADTDNLQCE